MNEPQKPEEYGEALVKRIKEHISEKGPISVSGNVLTFEGKHYQVENQKANTTVQMIVSLNGVPVDIQRAYAVSLKANEAYLHALAEARATVQMQNAHLGGLQTKIADLQSELQQLRANGE